MSLLKNLRNLRSTNLRMQILTFEHKSLYKNKYIQPEQKFRSSYKKTCNATKERTTAHAL